MTVVVAWILLAVALTGVIAAWHVRHVLHRDKAMLWRPGDAVPRVPHGSPLARMRGRS